jgi:hypothetical protein
LAGFVERPCRIAYSVALIPAKLAQQRFWGSRQAPFGDSHIFFVEFDVARLQNDREMRPRQAASISRDP